MSCCDGIPISQLTPFVLPYSGTEQFPIIQNAETRVSTFQSLVGYFDGFFLTESDIANRAANWNWAYTKVQNRYQIWDQTSTIVNSYSAPTNATIWDSNYTWTNTQSSSWADHSSGRGGTTQNSTNLAISAKDGGVVTGIDRGAHSTDLQTERSLTSQVASGSYSTIAGGRKNTTAAPYSIVGGGQNNLIDPLGFNSTIAGGQDNRIIGEHSVVVGGRSNKAFGDYSVVAGRNAEDAGNSGSFVFADATGSVFQSILPNSFNIRAQNGLRLIDGNEGDGRVLTSDLSGTGHWTVPSNWDSTYTTVNVNSADWVSTYTILNSNSGYWNSLANYDHTLLENTSASWTDTRTTVYNTSAEWADHADLSLLESTSSSWNNNYNWTSSQSSFWINTNTYIQETAPASPPAVDGDLWYNSATGSLYIYYTDLDSSQWVDTGGDMTAHLYDHTLLEATSSNWDNAYSEITSIGLGGNNITNADSISANSITVSEIYAISSYTHYQDIIVSELSGFNVTGDVSINGSAEVNNTLSANIIYVTGGNSELWNNNYNWTNSQSSTWADHFDSSLIESTSATWSDSRSTVNANSAAWDAHTDPYDDSLLQSTSADWSDSRSTVNANSAAWAIDTIYDDSLLQSTSGNWDSNYSWTNANSAAWADHFDSSEIAAASGNWDSTYTTVSANSAVWSNTANTLDSVTTNGATTLNDIEVGKIATLHPTNAANNNSATGTQSVSIGGMRNLASETRATTFGGRDNTVSGTDSTSVGGNKQSVIGHESEGFGGTNVTLNTKYTNTVGGANHVVGLSASGAAVSSAKHSITVGGENSIIEDAIQSAIVGGDTNKIQTGHDRSVILGGTGITTDAADTVFVPNLNVKDGLKIPTGAVADYVLTTDANGVGTWQDPTVAPVYTFATLPTPVQGMRVFISDSNQSLAAGIGLVAAAGGANVVPVFYDGSGWVIG